ncbi:MAG: DUF4249 family protein [Bacteroidales bacterium]|jgi:hypothetical protein|nr:DUF4249 family protein [Bacteroidales bacterium]MBQ2195067.1 DUF4249 family protein [Bacteroidales bacterium]MBQ5438469.1 DUF4249 family protein [Bacteroidales bacterium]
MKTLRHIFVFLLCAWVSASCIYDFDPQIDGEGGYMIVSGDLVIGTVSSVSLSYSWSLVDTTATSQERMQVLRASKMHVEDSQGGRYENFYTHWDPLAPYMPSLQGSPYGSFDLREADPSLEYRLVIENANGTYASSWSKALSPGVIDSLSFRINDNRTFMHILVSAHGDGQEDAYYRWTVTENWEYHSDVESLFKVVRTGEYPNYVYDLEPYSLDENIYYCWSSGTRGEILTASIADLTEDRLVDHQLYSLGNRDERLSVLYAAIVQQSRISGEAYRYWETMRQNGTDIGGLFSPEPYEHRGNVVNLDHPEELVLGYVDVQSTIRDTLFVENAETRFYRSSREPLPAPDTLSTPDEWKKAFETGFLPGVDVYHDLTGRLLGYEWWPARCVDCRYRGGTKDKPSWWPNSHK